MSEHPWVMRTPPVVPPGAAAPWRADIATPADVTASRSRLHEHARTPGPEQRAGDDALGTLLLTYEELTSNAVRHGRLPVNVTVVTSDDEWLIDVQDRAIERGPVPAVDRDPARGGMGLHLVARLCSGHGWWIERQQKHVWASIRRSPAAG